MADRIPCVVPFCRRTTHAGQFNEWICARHWPRISPTLRRRKHRIARALARAPYPHEEVRLIALSARIWERCKAAAIEAAGGIG